MKKVIDGALYNTSTARFLADIEPAGYDQSNFSYFSESLYRTKSGKFFLHCEGGPNSKYGVWHENSGGWGEEIRPLSPEQARAWSEEHLDGDVYADIFGEPDEAAEGNTTFCWSTSPAVLDRLRELKPDGKSLSAMIDEAVKAYYKL